MESGMHIGEKIKILRQKRKLKQLDLANTLRVTPQAVSKWEKEANTPDLALVVKLARFFNVTTDYLLGSDDAKQGLFEATVFYSSLRNFAKDSTRMDAKRVADKTNVIFHHLTERVLAHGGVPVKYVGDGFLSFFSGPAHEARAVEAALDAKEVVNDESLVVALNSGEIYFGSIGHPDYASRDVCGESVNLVFLISEWVSKNSRTGVGVTGTTAGRIKKTLLVGQPKKVFIGSTQSEVLVSEVRTRT
jgi:transcriptional regulator with XRE-family HTH domain